MTPDDARILPLHVADVRYPTWHPRDGIGPVFAFAVTAVNGWVLVDTGVGPPHQRIDAMYAPTRYGLQESILAHGMEGAPLAIVISHLHFDHCGGAAEFVGTPMLVQRDEWEAAQAPRYTVPEFVDFPGANYNIITGAADVAPGVRLIPTPGHTPGHQSVIVDTAEGAVIIAAQAAETIAEWEAQLRGESGAESNEARQSLDTLASLEPVAVYLSHDARVWRRD